MSSTSQEQVLSHWSALLENLQGSPMAFYASVGQALERRQIPQTRDSRVEHKEAGLLSAQREYMRVEREKLLFDICGAPFGTGFFVSWWFVEELPKLNPIVRVLVIVGMLVMSFFFLNRLGLFGGTLVLALAVAGGLSVVHVMSSSGQMDDGIVRALPLLGTLYLWLFRPATYYRIDSMQMFQEAVHNAVLEVIDGMTTAKGLQALSEGSRKPIMTDFYKRKLG